MSSREDLLTADYYSALNEAVEEEYNDNPILKKEKWAKMRDSLIFAGYARRTLSVKIAEEVEGKFYEKYGYEISIRTSHYYRTMKEWKCTNVDYNKPIPEKISETQETEKTAPAGELKNSSTEETEEKPEEPKPVVLTFRQKNKRLIDLMYGFKESCDSMIDYARHNDVVEAWDVKESEEIMGRLEAWNVNMMDYMNFKQTIPVKAQLIILRLYSGASDINSLFTLFFDELKRVHVIERVKSKKSNQIITMKEFRKYHNREVKKLSQHLEIHDGNEAILAGFWGQKCPTCGGYRTQIVPNMSNKVRCLKCSGRDNYESFDRKNIFICKECHLVSEGTDSCDHCKRLYCPTILG